MEIMTTFNLSHEGTYKLHRWGKYSISHIIILERRMALLKYFRVRGQPMLLFGAGILM